MGSEPLVELRAEGGNYLRMSSFKFFEDDSGGRCDLEVKSGGIFLRMTFWFDLEPFKEFVSSLSSIAERLTGTASLGLEHEPSRIAISAAARGHIKVEGKLYVGMGQEVKFAFESDQSFIPPFIDALKALSDSPLPPFLTSS